MNPLDWKRQHQAAGVACCAVRAIAGFRAALLAGVSVMSTSYLAACTKEEEEVVLCWRSSSLSSCSV